LAIRSKPDSGKRFSARDVFKGLTEAVTGVELATSQSTLGIYTSYYSSCKDKSYTTPLNDASVAAQYNYDVMNNLIMHLLLDIETGSHLPSHSLGN
jgi:hypothetical protein